MQKEEIKELLEYALNEKPKYNEVYTYIKDNIIEPKENRFINKEVLYANIEQLYNRARVLETIFEKLMKEK